MRLGDLGRSKETLLQTYLRDADELQQVQFAQIIVDEAHRLKNAESQMHIALAAVSFIYCLINNLIKVQKMRLDRPFTMLLTGTPIQNNLLELYSLLMMVHMDKFTDDGVADFLTTYASVSSDDRGELWTLARYAGYCSREELARFARRVHDSTDKNVGQVEHTGEARDDNVSHDYTVADEIVSCDSDEESR